MDISSKATDDYLEKNGITDATIATRYIGLLRRIHDFINVKKIGGSIRVDTDLLKRAVMDYFVDITRIKEFHEIPEVSSEKIYGYLSYWLLRRKPIQVVGPFPGGGFINELFVTSYLVTNILAEKHIGSDVYGTNKSFYKFQELLYYNLKYRPVSQQSFELMVGAFFCGYDITVGLSEGKLPKTG
jgi:hypothetical protein